MANFKENFPPRPSVQPAGFDHIKLERIAVWQARLDRDRRRKEASLERRLAHPDTYGTVGALSIAAAQHQTEGQVPSPMITDQTSAEI